MADHPYHGPWPRIRRSILDRDGHRCQIQGPRCKGDATHVDHIVPWSEGGAWYEPDNLRAACETCNSGRVSARLSALANLNRQKPTKPSREW